MIPNDPSRAVEKRGMNSNAVINANGEVIRWSPGFSRSSTRLKLGLQRGRDTESAGLSQHHTHRPAEAGTPTGMRSLQRVEAVRPELADRSAGDASESTLTRIFHTPAAGADAQAIFVGFGMSRSRKGRSAHTTPLPPCGSDQKTPRFSLAQPEPCPRLGSNPLSRSYTCRNTSR